MFTEGENDAIAAPRISMFLMPGLRLAPSDLPTNVGIAVGLRGRRRTRKGPLGAIAPAIRQPLRSTRMNRFGLSWFGPKTFGWGATPRSWQGWLVVVLFIAGIVALQWIPGLTPRAIWAARAGLLVGFLLVIWATYDPTLR